jgi:homoserine acetyltransferase
MLTFSGLSSASRATTLTYRTASPLSTKFLRTFRVRLVCRPPSEDYPTSFRGHAKPVSSKSLGVPVGAGLPFGVPFPGGQEEL